MIEAAYLEAEARGLAVWCEDEAGPFQAVPTPGPNWCPTGQPTTYASEYVRGATAKLLTLFHPLDGQVRVKGVTQTTNAILHPWLYGELRQILAVLPERTAELSPQQQRAEWTRWQEGLSVRFTLPAELPPLRMLLILDNLAGHKTAEFVLWCCRHGVMLLYTPLGGSWLNMAESIQRILKRRALEGTHPPTSDAIITWLEETAVGWNRIPTPFIWGGKRADRRVRAHQRRHGLAGSGACTPKPLPRRRPSLLQVWRQAARMTH